MTTHSEQQTLPYSCKQLFNLVADIERYPEFLPWCRAARIVERHENSFLGELVIRFSALSESYTSRVDLTPPGGDHAPAAIEVTMVKGPFAHLINRWRFTPQDGATHIDFFIDFKFRSRLLDAMIGGLFHKAAARMMAAFKSRAEALYGNQGSETGTRKPEKMPLTD